MAQNAFNEDGIYYEFLDDTDKQFTLSIYDVNILL